MGNMRQILRSDWPLAIRDSVWTISAMKSQKSAVDSQNKRKHKRSTSLLTLMIKAKSFCWIRNPLLTKLVRSRWLDISLVLLLRFSWTEMKSRSIKIQKRNSADFQSSWPRAWSMRHVYISNTPCVSNNPRALILGMSYRLKPILL